MESVKVYTQKAQVIQVTTFHEAARRRHVWDDNFPKTKQWAQLQMDYGFDGFQLKLNNSTF